MEATEGENGVGENGKMEEDGLQEEKGVVKKENLEDVVVKEEEEEGEVGKKEEEVETCEPATKKPKMETGAFIQANLYV